MSRRSRSCSRSRSRRRSSRGYSLLEILIVIAIIGLITGITAVSLFKFVPEARIKTSVESARNLRNAASLYRMDHPEECPTVPLLRTAALLDEAAKTTDAWDVPMTITCDERGGIAVASAGPDKKMGTSDDLRVPEPPSATSVAN